MAESPDELPVDPVLQLMEDPACAVLFTSMKFGWQFYYVSQAALLRHVTTLKPEMSAEDCAALISRLAQAALMAARSQPPTAKKLYESLRDTCAPVLRELGITEDEISTLDL